MPPNEWAKYFCWVFNKASEIGAQQPVINISRQVVNKSVNSSTTKVELILQQRLGSGCGKIV